MRRWHPALLFVLAACGGADPSTLIADSDGAVAPTPDASAPPLDDGGLSTADATTLDATDDAATSDDGSLPPADADVSDATDGGVDVDAGPVDPGVTCGQSPACDPSAELCCITQTQYYPQAQYSYACQSLSSLTPCVTGTPVYCDDDHDCASGVCCGDLANGSYAKVSCKATCSGYVFPYQEIHFCDPNAPTCATGQTCQASTVLVGYHVCN